MISLVAQVGVNPAFAHNPIYMFEAVNCPHKFSVGSSGEVAAWTQEQQIDFIMFPSLNGESEKLQAITAAIVRYPDQVEGQTRIITLHDDGRMRVWSQEDGTCINVSAHRLITDKVSDLIHPDCETRYLLAISENTFHVVDLWTLELKGSPTLKKDSFSRFIGASIDQKMNLLLQDNVNKQHKINVRSLFEPCYRETSLDSGLFMKNQQQVQKIISTIGEIKIDCHYHKFTKKVIEVPEKIKVKLQAIKAVTLFKTIFSQKFIEDYPQIEEIFGQSQAVCSALYFVQGKGLFIFLGTEDGTLFGIPYSADKDKPFILLKQERQKGSSVKYLRIWGNTMFVSWQNGYLGVFHIHNLQSVIESYQNKKESLSKKVDTIDATKLLLTIKIIPSSIKYCLPVLDFQEGKPKGGVYFFRLECNQIIRFDEQSTLVQHYRGVTEGTKVFCVLLSEEYVLICTSKGVESYSPLGFERTIQYSDWKWNDFESLKRRVKVNPLLLNTINTAIKFNSRIFIEQFNYFNDPVGILEQTFGSFDTEEFSNQNFPEFYFEEKHEIEKSLFSQSKESIFSVIKMKLNSIRRDSWQNVAFFIVGELNRQLQNFPGKDSIKASITNKFQFFSLFFWDLSKIPHLSKQYVHINKICSLKRRLSFQGAGKSLTVHLNEANRNNLQVKSALLLAQQSAANVAFCQCSIMKSYDMTEQMVECAEYFTGFEAAMREDYKLCLVKLAISTSQHISKGALNLLISAIITKGISEKSVQFYSKVLKSLEGEKLLNYQKTQCIIILGITTIFRENDIESDLFKLLLKQIIGSIQLASFQNKPYYLLAVMKVFNEGITKWKKFLSTEIIFKLSIELFRVFFLYEGLNRVSPDDKKFNFCFAKLSENQRKVMKQNIVKTVIYISKEYPHEFHQALKTESVNQKVHLSYPSSVIEILRQYLKSEKPQTHLVLYIEIILQCLSPITPQLRKYVQRSALNTLQLMCLYDTISFNHPSQKLAVNTSNHLYIYCLRTSTKWRTINLKNQKGEGNSFLQMSPKGTYIALLSDSLRIWRLSSGFWSGVLGVFSQDWVYQITGHGLKWEQNQQSITVMNENPSLNRVIKI